MVRSNAALAILLQFRWPLFFLLLKIVVNNPSHYDEGGPWQDFFNLYIYPAAYLYVRMAPYLILLSVLNSLLKPILMWSWNRRLADYVAFLQRTGKEEQSKQLAGKYISDIGWARLVTLFLVLACTFISLARLNDLIKMEAPLKQLGGVRVGLPVLTEVQLFIAASFLVVFLINIQKYFASIGFLWECPDDPAAFLEEVSSADGKKK